MAARASMKISLPFDQLGQVVAGTAQELFPSMIQLDQPWSADPPEAYCPRCGSGVGPGEVVAGKCAQCQTVTLPWQRLVRLGCFGSPLAQCIRDLKFRGHWKIAQWLGQQLAQSLPAGLDGGPLVVCPVPMFWARRWRRGYNQATLIADALARTRGWPMIRLLRRSQHRPPQTSVPASKRSLNVRNSFAVVHVDLSGHEVVLVDDVKTTGATLTACSRLLCQAGAQRITIAVAAVADTRLG